MARSRASCPGGHEKPAVTVSAWTRAARATLSVAGDAVATHDLEQARVIGESQILRGTRDVPLVPLQCGHDDLALRFRLELHERLRAAFTRGRASHGIISNLGRYVLDADHIAIGRDDHALDRVAQLAH